MSSPPVVSVVMTVYNDERFVSTAVDSILKQTFQDFEFVIVDDGSTDGTPRILQKHAAIDPRIRVITQSNRGTTAAANRGIAESNGRYIARLDSDDLSYPHRLAVEVDFLTRHPNVGLVGGGSDIIDLDGCVIGRRNVRTNSPHRTLLHRCIFQQSDVMFSRSIALQVGAYREKFRNGQDYDLWLRISEAAEVAKLDVILGQWRLNPGGYTLSRRYEQNSEAKIIREFAKMRRRGGTDGYNDYQPPVSFKGHRQPVSSNEYDAWVAAALLQAGRGKEARARVSISTFRPLLANRSIILLYLLTFLPSLMLRFIARIRSAILSSA